MSEDEIVFWDRAENPEFEAWLKAAEAVVGEGNIQEVLHSDLAGGLHINPIYTDEITDSSLDEVSEVLVYVPQIRQGILKVGIFANVIGLRMLAQRIH